MTTFRMKIENREGEPREVDLQSLGSTAKAWAEMVEKTAKLILENLPDEDTAHTSKEINVHLRVTKVDVASIDLRSHASSDLELPQEFWDTVHSYLRTGFGHMERGIRPELIFPSELRQPAKDLISTFGSNGIGRLQFGVNGTLDSELTWDNAGQLITPIVKERSHGSAEGTIASISLAGRPKFGMRVARGKIISCNFNAGRLLTDVTQNLTKRVMVVGTMVRDQEGTLLSVGDVISISPLGEAEDFAPVQSVFGSWPEITDDLSSTGWTGARRGR